MKNTQKIALVAALSAATPTALQAQSVEVSELSTHTRAYITGLCEGKLNLSIEQDWKNYIICHENIPYSNGTDTRKKVEHTLAGFTNDQIASAAWEADLLTTKKAYKDVVIERNDSDQDNTLAYAHAEDTKENGIERNAHAYEDINLVKIQAEDAHREVQGLDIRKVPTITNQAIPDYMDIDFSVPGVPNIDFSVPGVPNKDITIDSEGIPVNDFIELEYVEWYKESNEKIAKNN